MSTHAPWLPIALLALCCCATSHPIPDPPSDEDLASNGTPEEKAALIKSYGVQVHESPVELLRRVTVGDADLFYTAWGVSNPNLREYVSSDPEAEVEFPRTWQELGQLCLYSSVFLGLPAVLLMGVGALGLAAGSGLSRSEVDHNSTFRAVFYNAADPIFLTGVLLGIAGLLAGGALALVGTVISWRLSNARTRAIGLFNANLAHRINEGAQR